MIPTGYYVERHEGEEVRPACGTDPDHPTNVTACLDPDLLQGHTYTWVVTALYRSWTATSDPSTPLTITSVVPLVVSGVVPGVGPVAGGTAITVSGSGFVAGSLVLVGGRPATSVSVVDAGTITAVTPPGRVGAVDVTVVKPDGTSATLAGGFTYQAAPVVRRVTPREGPASGGTLVTITGRDFGAGAAVWFGDAQASSVVVVDSRTVTAVSPAHVPGTVAVAVTTAGGTGTLRDAFTYRPAPVALSGVVPGVGPVAGGTAITVSGSGFVAGSLVLVGGRPATSVSVVDAGTITAVTPPGRVGAVDVTVVKPDGTSATLAGGFTYQAAPVVRRVTPREGPASGGTLVTITGRDFGAGAAVWFGDAQASSVVVVDSRTVTAVSPAHVPGTVTVAVTTAGGTGTLRNAFSYRPTARTTLDPTTPATTTKAESPADAPVTVSTTATDSGQADPQETAPLIPNPSAGSSASAILSPSPAATPSSSPSPEEFEGSEAPTARLKPDPVPSATT